MTTKMTQSAFAAPPMSWLRKMSEKTTMRSQIQMMKMKISNIVQNRSSSG